MLNRRARRRAQFRENFPLKGFDEHRYPTRFVDALSDEELVELNEMLPWNCFTVDRHGRRLGNAAWEGKRTEPEQIPHPRIVAMHEKLGLSGKHVLELGCFEGVHTIGLCRLAGRVTAVDSRIENVVKTTVRCGMFDVHPTVFKCNVEDRNLDPERMSADLAYHVGVLYHLVDPVRHLADLGRWIREGMMLCTHVAREGKAEESYDVDGCSYRYMRYREGGIEDAFSGMCDHAKWLEFADLELAIRNAGFEKIEVLDRIDQRNGPRVSLIARR